MNFSLLNFQENKIARKKRNTVHNISIGEIEFGVKRSPKGLAKKKWVLLIWPAMMIVSMVPYNCPMTNVLFSMTFES